VSTSRAAVRSMSLAICARRSRQYRFSPTKCGPMPGERMTNRLGAQPAWLGIAAAQLFTAGSTSRLRAM
jgi:hypothetical protein